MTLLSATLLAFFTFFDVIDIRTRHIPATILVRNVPSHRLYNDSRCTWIGVIVARSGLNEKHATFGTSVDKNKVVWVDSLIQSGRYHCGTTTTNFK
jgi:hypothetical protein